MRAEEEVIARVETGQTALVWQQGWSMQCCGTPFAVGDTVEWDLDDIDGRDMAWTWGPWAGLITAEDARHEGANSPYRAEVSVRTIWAAYCYPTRSNPPPEGSRVLHRALSAPRWPAEVPGMSFSGYLVEVRR